MSAIKAPNGAIYEKNLITAGLATLGMGSGCEIVIADNPAMVELTAAEELRKFLVKAEVFAAIVPESKARGKRRFLLGRDPHLRAIKALGDRGALDIRNVSTEDDGFHVKSVGEDVAVAGANPRGVLYGVYALEECVNTGATGNLDVRKIPHFRKRGSGPYYSFNGYVNLGTEDFPEEKAAYLSRMGVNQLTDQGVGGCLHEFVRSDVFPFQTPPKADFQRKVKAMSAVCKKYGLDHYLFLNEPALASIAGALETYPPEALGTVNRPWGSPKVDRTLCVNSPIVQEHYRNMMRKLVREYPDVKGVQFYNFDGPAWLCTPALCDRCKASCTDSPQHEYNPWETQAELVTLLAEAAHAEDPAFDFKLWGAVHYHGAHFEKMIHAAQGYSSLMSCWNASDRDAMVADTAELDPAFLGSQKVCEERAIPLYMLNECNNLEAVPRSLPFPFHVCDALKKFKQWNVTHLTEIYGLIPEHNPINALVTKECQWDPNRNPEEFLAGLSVRQFGKTAGSLMYRAWGEMEEAFDVWNDMQLGPLSGSQGYLSLGTACGIPKAILPDVVDDFNHSIEIRINVEPWRVADYQKLKTTAFLDKMKRMNVHLERAAEHAEKAVAAASEREFIGICWYEGVGGRPTCKEYAELNYAPIAIAEALCRQRCDSLRACRLLTEIEGARADGDETSVRSNTALYRELIHEDIVVQERFCELLIRLAGRRPCYTRASLTEREIAEWISGTRAKIDALRDFLRTQPLPGRDGGVGNHQSETG